MRPVHYEPSTSGWHVLLHRRRAMRRRLVRVAVGGATLLAVGAIAGLYLGVDRVAALSLVR